MYSLALAPRLLVCLSGWSILAWRVHTEKPDVVRGQFQTALPDLQVMNFWYRYLYRPAAQPGVPELVGGSHCSYQLGLAGNAGHEAAGRAHAGPGQGRIIPPLQASWPRRLGGGVV